jgi:hypothetical protein
MRLELPASLELRHEFWRALLCAVPKFDRIRTKLDKFAAHLAVLAIPVSIFLQKLDTSRVKSLMSGVAEGMERTKFVIGEAHSGVFVQHLELGFSDMAK